MTARDYPKIKMNYLSTQEDRDVAAKALKIVRKIMLNTETFLKSMNLKNIDLVLHITDMMKN